MKLAAAIVLLSFVTSSTFAAMKTQTIEYKVGDTTCKGYLAYDDAKVTATKPAPGFGSCTLVTNLPSGPKWYGVARRDVGVGVTSHVQSRRQ